MSKRLTSTSLRILSNLALFKDAYDGLDATLAASNLHSLVKRGLVVRGSGEKAHLITTSGIAELEKKQ